jgi:hypothetical protein
MPQNVNSSVKMSPLLFNLYSEYITQEALGDFKVAAQIISTVRYADDLVLLAKEETTLQSMMKQYYTE